MLVISATYLGRYKSDLSTASASDACGINQFSTNFYNARILTRGAINIGVGTRALYENLSCGHLY